VPRQLGNLEIREAINARVLAFAGVVVGSLMGILVGRGLGEWTPTLALAWNGVTYGETEPLLGHDLGLYLAQLPLWRDLHGYLLLLVLLALGGVLTLYVVIGAVRWTEGTVAINGHARAHLGVLLAAVALCLVWGYLLEPYEIVAGIAGEGAYEIFDFNLVTTQILAGAALAAAVLSLVWAWRAKHTLMAAGWAVLVVSSLLGSHILPALIGRGRVSAVAPDAARRLNALAFGLTGMRDSTVAAADRAAPMPAPASLWSSAIVTRLPAPDSGQLFAAERAVLPVLRRPRPVWLLVRSDGRGAASVSAIADDQTTLVGQALFYPGGDSLSTALPSARIRLSANAVWPGAPGVVVDTTPGGVRVGSGARRVALAWALQTGALLGSVEPQARARWYLTPSARLSRLAPFATWGIPTPRVVGSDLVWISDGYLATESFPIASRVHWRGERVGGLRASFVGVVEAETGEAKVYLRHTADPVAEAWRSISGGVVLPAAAIPPEIGRLVPYPLEALQVQGRILQDPIWDVGSLIGRQDSLGGAGPVAESLWEPDTLGLQSLLAFERENDRTVRAVLQGRMVDGWESLRLVRLDSLATLPSPPVLETRWGRFPTFEQIRDSVLGAGGQFQSAPVYYWLGPGGLGAYQLHFSWSAGQDPSLVWVSIATPGRGGAGHDMLEAWQNMLGVTSPLVAAAGRNNQLEEARRYMAAADSALRRGDMAAFGRAFDGLRRILSAQEERPRF
jgi:hypothetical protein